MTDAWDTPASAEMRDRVNYLLAGLTARADLQRSVMDGEGDFAQRTGTVLTAIKEIGGSLDQALHETCMHAFAAGPSYETLGKWAGVPWGVLEGETESYREDLEDAENEDGTP